MTHTPASCWIVTDGAVGHEKQCRALCRYLGLGPELFEIELRQPWDALAPYWHVGGRRAIRGALAERLAGPLPDLLLTAGRRAVLAALTIKRLSSGSTFTCQVMDPKIDPRRFDLVICPRHDGLAGANVITSLGALHEVDEHRLASARECWQETIGARPAPRVAVLIGASNRAFEIGENHIEDLAAAAEALAGSPRSILVTTARRTPPALRAFVASRFPESMVWTGPDCGDNPYLGYLAWADHIIVSADSVSMLSEAAGTGKPVYCSPPGEGTPKFRAFLAALSDEGMIKPLEAAPAQADYRPLRETAEIAAELARRCAALRS